MRFIKVHAVFALAIICVLFGCSSGSGQYDDRAQIVKISEITTSLGGRFRILCDKATGMAYLYYGAANRSAITAYLDSDGNPSRCSDVAR